VEGLRSWEGEGARFMEAVWIVSAICRGIEEDMLGLGCGFVGVGEVQGLTMLEACRGALGT